MLLFGYTCYMVESANMDNSEMTAANFLNNRKLIAYFF